MLLGTYIQGLCRQVQGLVQLGYLCDLIHLGMECQDPDPVTFSHSTFDGKCHMYQIRAIIIRSRQLGDFTTLAEAGGGTETKSDRPGSTLNYCNRCNVYYYCVVYNNMWR